MFHIITTYLSSTLILLSGLFLLFIKVPDKEKWRYLRICRSFILISYTIIACAGIGSILYEINYAPIPDRRAMVLSISFWQALLFTFISIAYIRPRWLTWKKCTAGVLCILPFAVIAAIGDRLGRGASTAAVIAYLVLMAVCIRLFAVQYRKGLEQLENHYDEDFSMRMGWVPCIFYGALVIGLMALVYSVFNTGLLWYDLFIIAHTVFYMYVVNRMRYCLKNGSFLVDALAEVQDRHLPVREHPAACPDTQSSRLDQNIQEWIGAEKYLESDVSIDQVADSLQATRDELNEWCSAHHGLLFRTWRMQLRIGKAKEILSNDPDIKIADLQALSGFTDKSHFFKQFKQITGMTPTQYRNQFRNRKA